MGINRVPQNLELISQNRQMTDLYLRVRPTMYRIIGSDLPNNFQVWIKQRLPMWYGECLMHTAQNWSWNLAPPITDYIDLNGDARPGDAMDGLTRKECVNEWAVFLSRIESSEKYTALWVLFVDLSTQLTRFDKLVPPPTWPTDLIAAEYWEKYRAEVFLGA